MCFAGLSRAGYGSYADEELSLLEFLNQQPGTSDGGVVQFHSSYASVDQTPCYRQKLLFTRHPDGHYDTDLADRLCQLSFAQRSLQFPAHKTLDATSAVAEILTLTHPLWPDRLNVLRTAG